MAKASTKSKIAEKVEAEVLPEIRGIKGFNRDLTCLDFQFEVGSTYEAKGKIVACKNGFHAIPEDVNPLMVFGYYEPGNSIFGGVGFLSSFGLSPGHWALSNAIGRWIKRHPLDAPKPRTARDVLAA